MPRTLEDVDFVQNIVSKGLGYPLAQSRLGSASDPASVLLARLVKHKLGSMSPMSQDTAGAALLQLGVCALLICLCFCYIGVSCLGMEICHGFPQGR